MTNNKTTISDMVYYLYFIVMLGAKAIGLYEGLTLYNVAIVLGMLLFGIKVLLTKHTVLEYIIISLLLAMSVIIYKNSGEKGVLFYMTMMLGIKGVKLAKIEKLGAAIIGVSFTVLSFASVTGLIDGKHTISGNRFFGGEVLRHYWGYPNCNVTHTTFVVLMMLIVLSREYKGRKNQLITCFIMYALNIYVYLYTMSNTGLIAATVFVISYLFIHRNNIIGKVDGIFVMLVYPLCMFISIGLPMLIKGELFWALDRILHNRMNYPHYWLTHEPITLFGVRFGKAPNTDYYIDSSFLYSFLQIGVIPCIVLAFFMMAMVYNLVMQNRKTEIAVYVSLCVLGLSDPFFYNLAYKNILFLFIGDMFFGWVGRLEKALPSVFGYTVQIIPIGSKEINNVNNLSILFANSWNTLEDVIRINAIRYLMVFVILSATVFAAAYFVISPGTIIGAINTIDEWEYLRLTISLGIWASTFAVLVMALIEASIKRHR